MFKTVVPAALAQTRRLMFPPLCLGCRRLVDRPGALCARCWPKLVFLERPWCEVLGLPFEHDQGEGAVSPAAIADPPPFDRARGGRLCRAGAAAGAGPQI